MTERPHDLPSLASYRDYRMAVPTDEHFLPLLYLAGLATVAQRPADVLVDGDAFGSLSMAAYTLGAHGTHAMAAAADVAKRFKR